MNELHDLAFNIALLIALAALYQVVISRLPLQPTTTHVIFGILFGLAAVLAMVAPIVMAPGLIFDGRSVILAVSGLVGGPLMALISATMAAAYRIWLGGPGAIVGVSVIIASAAIGTGFHYYRRNAGGRLSILQLYGLGLLVHVVMLVLFLFLPGDAGLEIIRRLGPYFMLAYPLTTMAIGLLFQDYEEQQRSRARLHELAYFDPLTGLPNRTCLMEHLERLLAEPAESRQTGILLLVNLDRFKTVNDARGHTSGDALLLVLNDRIRALLQDEDLLARAGGDEFSIVVLRRTGDPAALMKEIADLAERLLASIRQPLAIGHESIAITAAIGATLFRPDSDDTVGDVLRRADTALHQAKRRGGNQSVFFEAPMSADVEYRFNIEHDLRNAITNDELRLFLQAQVEADGTVVGAEALVRWQHPKLGLVAPASFIPIAEDSDLIIDIGVWVFTATCRLLVDATLANRPLRLSVNISPRHFRQPGFVSWIIDTLHATGADPRRITLEITEGLLIENVSDVGTKMNALADIGIQFSVDDFGTGYSSLNYLKRLPIHEIKIDKSFVLDAPQDPSDATLIDTILAVAERMSLKVVAEGVERDEHVEFFRNRDGVIRQGYFYGRPEPAATWLARL